MAPMPRRADRNASRWDEDNRLSLNPWAFAAVGGAVLGIAGLALLFAYL
jgi:hypothetical protein